MTEMPKCLYCGEPLTVEPDCGLFAMNCNNGECYGNIDVWYSTPEEAIAAASKRYADTARLTEVTKQVVEAVRGAEFDDTGEQGVNLIDQIENIICAANVTDERDAVELSTLVMAAIAEAFEPGGVK